MEKARGEQTLTANTSPITAHPRRRHTAIAAVLCIGLSACSSSSSGPDATREATRTNGSESVAVNRYIWQAAFDTLSFLPVETVDPFTGVIVFGYGTPPGGGTSYRATVLISDPALDARSLNVALATRSGPVASGTQRVVEDAILSRARQLRVAGGAL